MTKTIGSSNVKRSRLIICSSVVILPWLLQEEIRVRTGGISRPIVDVDQSPPSDEKYGYTEDDPIKVGGGVIGGPRNERKFLASLRGPEGEMVRFRRLGSCCFYKLDDGEMGLLDKYEVTHSGLKKPVVLYLDIYRYEKPRVPIGFTLIETKSQEESPGS